MTVETREIRNEKTIIIMSVTDFTDSIVLKIFTRNEDRDELLGNLKKGAFLKIKGVTTIDKFDSELTIGSIVGIKKIADFTTTRMDTSPEKRVELHCHTKMSDMDGVSECKDIVKRAMKWGHKAIAITDHGDVQAFPDANHTVPSDSDFKVIYGVEAYLVDDLKGMVTDSQNQDLDADYVVFDLETTGFSPETNRIIEIGAVKVQNGKIVDKFSTFVNPQVPIPFRIEQLTSINDSMVIDAPVIADILPEFMKFCEGCVMVAHNADFDMSFIKKNCQRLDIPCKPTIVDTVALARVLLPNLNRFKLDTVAKALGVSAAELLTGDFKENENPSGNMKKMHFYVCPVCGNIITAVGQSSISCCGVSLPELLAEPEEDAHGISVETVDHEYCVTMTHPMEKKHYISFIAYVTADSCEVVKLYPEQGISVRFRKKGHGILYAYCNRHGMFAVHSYRKLPAYDRPEYGPHWDPLKPAGSFAA